MEETDPSIRYTGAWMQADPRPWSGGTAAVSTAAGAQAEFAFTGTSVNWIGFRGPQAGIAEVFLDGNRVVVDAYSPTEQVQAVVFSSGPLANTGHTLRIQVTGRRNGASAEAYIAVDALDVGR